jgi:hypothetical protein
MQRLSWAFSFMPEIDLLHSYFWIVITISASAACWWHVSRSNHAAVVKLLLVIISSLPGIGPPLYLLVHTPERPLRLPLPANEKAARRRALLLHFHEQEHVYLGWASFVFWMLAVVAYWMNDWKPGAIDYEPWLWASYTDVDVTFYALLIGAVLTFGAALRAKIILDRRIKQASDFLMQATADQRRPAAE